MSEREPTIPSDCVARGEPALSGRKAGPITSAPCRSCGECNLNTFLSLGRTPLANALISEEHLSEPEETYPLDLAFCPDCSLVQITETVPPEKLFREYFYLSSFSDTMLRHAEEMTTRFVQERNLGARSLVIEVASNDGYLLQFYRKAGVSVLGIEPATNIARVAEERGIRTICEFFGNALAEQLEAEGIRADVIHAHNVLAHVADLNGVVQGIARLLKPAGVAVVEVPYVREMIDRCEFDTIYHEHLCYFSLTALNLLFRRHHLIISDVEVLPIHGGTLRICAEKREGEAVAAEQHGATRAESVDGRQPLVVRRMVREEQESGLARGEFYRGFGERVELLRRDLLNLLQDLKSQGRRIAVYGASAKGSTLLNFFGIGRETIEFVVDRSTVKQGYYTPGTHLRICAPEILLTEMPDYVLLLTWNFAAEILEQQQEYRKRGGRFIIPIPEVRVV